MTDKKDLPDIEDEYIDEEGDTYSEDSELFDSFDEDDHEALNQDIQAAPESLPQVSLPNENEIPNESIEVIPHEITAETIIEIDDDISEQFEKAPDHTPIFTSIDTLTEVPTSENFDENTYIEGESADTAIDGMYIQEHTSDYPLKKNKVVAAKEKFQQIKNGLKHHGMKFINSLKSLKKVHRPTGNGGNGGGDDGDGAKGLKLPPFIKNLDWDIILKTIFATENRAFHHRAFLITVFTLSSFYVGKFVGNIISVTPKSSANSKAGPNNGNYLIKRDVYAAVKKSNLFNSPEHISLASQNGKKITKVDPQDENKVCIISNKQTTLPFKLKNTIVLQDSVKSLASVEYRGQSEVMNLREGDNVEGIARIGRIERLKVVLKNLESGECEFIANFDKDSQESPLSKSSGNIVSPSQGRKLMETISDGSIVNEGNTYKIKKKVRDEMLENLDKLLTQARAIQIKNPDGSLAFKMTDVVPGSIYSKLDIRDGDIITKINGKPIKNLNEIMSLFGQIKNIDHFKIGLKRGGQPVNKEYNFE